jgi:hypothetical protein
MATLHWRSGVTGDWATGADWDLGLAPAAGDLALIDAAGVYTVTITAPEAVQSLTVNDAGATVVDSSTLTVGGALTVAAGVFDLAAGGVVSGGTLSATGGSFAWNGGALSGVTYQGPLDLTAAGATLLVDTSLVVTGAGGVGSGVINANGAAAQLTINGALTLDNLTLNVGSKTGGSTGFDFGDLTIGANAVLNQDGGALGASSLTMEFGTSLVNNGVWQALLWNSGAQAYLNSFTNNGAMTVGDGALIQLFSGAVTNTGVITSQFGGQIALSGSAGVTNSGVMNDAGTLSLSGPTLVNSGQINVTGNNAMLQVDGATAAAPMAMTGTGSINLSGIGSNLDFIGSETIQQGTINLSASNNQIWNMAGGAPTPFSVLTFGSQAVINQTAGSALIKDDGVAGSQVINDGVINASASQGILIAQTMAFVNNGIINVSNGDTLFVRSALDGTGTVNIAGPSTVELAAGAATTQTVHFSDAAGDVLKLDAAAQFIGAITGFSAGDTIDLVGVSANSAVLNGGMLTVGLTGGGTLNLAVAGNTAGQFVHTVSDNAGGTDIVLTGSAAQPAPAPVPVPVITPGQGAIGLDLVSESNAGMAPPATVPTPIASINTATTTATPGAIAASSSATATDAATGATLTVNQSMTAAWIDSYTGTATFNDTWTESNTNGVLNESSATFWGASVTFTVDLAAGGAYDLSWLALESGASNFGMYNPYLSVDGGPVITTPSTSAVTATPIGDFTGTLSAGVHTLSILDQSNFFGSIGNGGTATSTLNETLKLVITPNAVPVALPRSYTVQGAALSVAEGSGVAAPVGTFTDSDATDLASQFSAVITWGDGTSTAGVVTGAAGVFSVADGGGHAYADEGSFVTGVVVTNAADASQAVLAGTAVATEADVLAALTAPALSGSPGQTVGGALATFSDTYAGSAAADFTASIAWGDGSVSVGLVTETAGVITVSGSHAYAAAGADVVGVTLLDVDGGATATAVGAAAITAPAPGAFVLTTHEDHLVGGAGNDLFIARSNTLSDGDVVDGGAGVNTLALVGDGVLNLSIPDQLAVQIVAAQEGAGATGQIVTLRENTAYAVKVGADPAHDPAAGITIFGADNKDVITLGAGHDTITLGVGETVNGGGGTATYIVNGDTIGDTINGGAGVNTLVVAGGGDGLAMGAAITGMTAVQLLAPSRFTANGTVGMTIAGSAAGGDVLTLGDASQGVIAGGANERIVASAAHAGAAIGGLGAGSVLEISGGGSAVMNATASVDTVKLDAATNLVLSGMSFMTATGSGGADSITAGATYQTLTGGSGADTLTGFSGGYDTFSDKASGLNGDMLRGFLATDRIDVTNLAYAHATLKAAASGSDTLVTVTSGSTKSVFTMAGSFSAAGFHLASDGGAGTFITHS